MLILSIEIWDNGAWCKRKDKAMPKRKYKTDPKRLLAEGQLIVKADNDAKFQHRVEMVNLVLAGMVPSKLSKLCGDSKNAITLWVKTADERGFNALRDKKQTGRPPKLSKDQLAEIRKAVEHDDPKVYDLAVWDGPALSSFIKKRYGVKLGVRQCQRLLHTLGFSLVRPQTFPAKNQGNEQARKAYKKTL